MRSTGFKGLLLAALAAALAAPPAAAQDLPAVGGSYVMPVFRSGSVGVRSYLRLHNPTAADGTAAVYFFESGSGAMIGRWSVGVPARASLQTEMNIIEAAAVPPVNSTRNYTAYVNADFNGFVQHIVWNDRAGALTNLTNCGRDTADNATTTYADTYTAFRGSFTFTTGTGGSRLSTFILEPVGAAEVDILGGQVTWPGSASAMAAAAAAQINAFASSPDYTATSSGAVLTITGGPGTNYGTSPRFSYNFFGSIGQIEYTSGQFVAQQGGAVCDGAGDCLGNVHTTLIGQYPSFLQIYNPGAARSLALDVYDSVTGELIGSPSVNLAASSSTAITIASLEQAMGYQPDIYHYNIALEPGFGGYAVHMVNNQVAGVLTNMTDKCVLNRVEAP